MANKQTGCYNNNYQILYQGHSKHLQVAAQNEIISRCAELSVDVLSLILCSDCNLI